MIIEEKEREKILGTFRIRAIEKRMRYGDYIHEDAEKEITNLAKRDYYMVKKMEQILKEQKGSIKKI